MNAFSIAGAAVAGLPAGTLLRGQVARLSVPGGEPDEEACRSCAAPLPGRPALRCEACESWIGPAAAIELVTAAVLALLAASIGPQPALAAFGYLAVAGVALAQVDTAAQRLPDRLTLPAYPAVVLLLALAAAAGHAWPAFGRALLAGLVLAAAYLVLGLASRGQLGGGDIKLAGLLGLALGWLSWGAVLAGAALGFVLAAAAGLVLLATRRASRRTMVSFGPYMLTGALIVAVSGLR
ncbi:MAG TPA: prepilin peptidase [Streptosporangiaceae bacterium]